MTNEDIKNHVGNIIEKTFNMLQYVYYKSQGSDAAIEKMPEKPKKPTRIIFPNYSNDKDKLRLSEQELRCLFIEQLNAYCDSDEGKEASSWQYSVETPTTKKYNFSDKDHLIVSPNDESSQIDMASEDGSANKTVESARIDLVIHDENKEPIALIEFKALNPGKFCFEKDFFKLKHESQGTHCPTFFVMFVENHRNDTIKHLHEKIETKDKNTEFYCYSFNEEEHRIEARIEESQPTDQTEQPNV